PSGPPTKGAARRFADSPHRRCVQMSMAPSTLAPGTPLKHYVIVSRLGAGGMGEVYRAHDEDLDRDVAIKVLPAHLKHNAEMHGRFEREARAAAALSHPN